MTAPNKGAQRSPRAPVGDSDTRKRVIDAAIACIQEQGLYRASSNAIAERAGLTWGVIQYYFGTREGLMLAVLEEAATRYTTELQDAKVTADDLEERVEQLFDILAAYYGRPDYLAFIQVVINLSHDPRTSEQARGTLSAINTIANKELHRLQNEVFAGTGIRRADVKSLLFHALRGLSLSQIMLDTNPMANLEQLHREIPGQRKLMIRALTLLFDQYRKA